MKKLILFIFLLASVSVSAQKKHFDLSNALIIGQMDRDDDRYSIEVSLTELFNTNGVKAMPSLNVLKRGESGEKLAEDSLKQLVAAKGFDTYVLVSVRGYDRKFRQRESSEPLDTALSVGQLYPIYSPDIVSVTFEFLFYRNGEYIGSDLVKCGNISDRESVLKRLRKKARKRLLKKWKK